jgi:magnesium transporter
MAQGRAAAGRPGPRRRAAIVVSDTKFGTTRTRAWKNGRLEAEGFPLEEVSDYLDRGDCLVWADVPSEDDDTLNQVAEELSLDSHAVEQAVIAGGRAKLDRYPAYLFLTCYGTYLDTGSGEISISKLSTFVTERALITVHREADVLSQAIVQQWDSDTELATYGVTGLLHGLLDVVIDTHLDAVQSLDDQIDDLEDLLFDDKLRIRSVQRRTYELRKSLVQVRRVVLPMREVVNTLLRRDLHIVPSELTPYYQDVYDHVLRASEWTDSLRDLVSTIFETNLSLQDARLNNVMKKLTAWAAIIAVPTAITGYYGQNVPYPGFGRHWGFWVSTAIIVGLILVLYRGFKKREWL